MSQEQPAAKRDAGWRWDASLYAGSASYYTLGRVAYPLRLAEEVAGALALDGSGVLLDVGCGPGSLTLLLAPHVAQAIGVDADAGMLAEACRLAAEQQVRNVTWRQMRAEDLPADLPSPRAVTFAQSFHWMERARVAAVVRAMIAVDGAVVHVGATTHEGLDSDAELPHPRPPRPAIVALVRQFLGTVRRAGQGVLPAGTAGGEDDIFREAGFEGPQRIEVPGRVVERTVEEVAASVYSLSSSAPHLFGDRLAAFDAELRQLLTAASDNGQFSEEMRSITVSIWR